MTDKQIDRNKPTPENQLFRARELPDSELRRHASVCLNNGCSANHVDRPESFTCACVIVARERGLLDEHGQLKEDPLPSRS